ncbi:MAG: hypothetical protein IPM17_07080 [Verrucomicrobia bacterium]|nr:hypothetical protein [Verrucomicrobiota bacterium]
MYTWDVTSAVEDWYAGGANNGLMLAASPSGGSKTHQFASRENTTSGVLPPTLEIDYEIVVPDINLSAVTDEFGHYGFEVPPGSYQLRFHPPAGYVISSGGPADPWTGLTACLTVAAGGSDLSLDVGMAGAMTAGAHAILELEVTTDQAVITAGQSATLSYKVTNVGGSVANNVVVKDDNGTPDDVSDDVIVGTIASLAPGETQTLTREARLAQAMCATINGVSRQVGTLSTEVLPNGDVKVIYNQSRDLVDNTYGNTAVGWPNGHKFSDLVGSDKAQFRFFRNGSSSAVLDITLDYISASSSFPSGFGTLGVSGGDGRVNSGNGTWVKSVNTTLSRTLNQPGNTAFTVNSPAEPNANWEYVNGYEMVIAAAAFGTSGFASVTVVEVHNSPPKIGSNAVVPTSCGSCTTFSATAVGVNGGGRLVTAAGGTEVCVSSAAKAVLGDFVWHDVNANGLQDAGETGIPGVKVELYRCGQEMPWQTTTTDANGYYGFDVIAGEYSVKFIAPHGFVFSPPNQGTDRAKDSNADPVSGEIDCVTIAAGGSNLTLDAGLYRQGSGLFMQKVSFASSANPGDLVEYFYTVRNDGPSPLTNIQVTDDNGTPDFPGDDIVIGTIASLAPGQEQVLVRSLTLPMTMCAVINNANMVVGTLILEPLANGDVKVIYRQSLDLTDNTYGTNASPDWPSGHTFAQLRDSDEAEFAVFNAAGTKVLQFKMDYLAASSGFPSGFGVPNVTAASPGNAAWVKDETTTLAKNLNQPGYTTGFTVNSPPASDPNWDPVSGYEFVIDKAAFAGSSFGRVQVVSVHNSPPKVGVNAVAPTPCGECVINVAYAAGYDACGRVAQTSAAARVCPPGLECDPRTSISSTFSKTSLPAGRYLWFNAHADSISVPGGASLNGLSIYFSNVKAVIAKYAKPKNGAPITVNLPDGVIFFDTTYTTPSTTWEGGRWVTRVSPTVSDPFLTGGAYLIPAGYDLKEAKSVTISAEVFSSVPDTIINWRWSAAAYTSFSLDNSLVHPTPVDNYFDATASRTFAQSGSPASFWKYLVAGARGDGKNGNYTGTFTAAGVAVACSGGSIGSLVWHDRNLDGYWQPGELGIGNVLLELFQTDSAGNLVDADGRPENGVTPQATTRTATTGEVGSYLFSGLAPGTYRVRVASFNFLPGQALASIRAASPLIGATDDQVDNDNNGKQLGYGNPALSPMIQLAVGTEPVDGTGPGKEFGIGATRDNSSDANGDMTVDFGFWDPDSDLDSVYSIGSLVWHDANNNGVVNAGEVGIPNVVVELFRTLPDGTPIDEDGKPENGLTPAHTTTTEADGTYYFAVVAGDYRVRIPVSNFATPGGALASYPRSTGTPVNLDNQVDNDNNGIQSGGPATEVWSPKINLSFGAEPLGNGAGVGTEFGPGGGQDDLSVARDANGDMTVDFGFWNAPPTAARLAYFKAVTTGDGLVQVTWGTLVENGVLGFRVERSTADGGWQRLTAQMIPATGWDGRPQSYGLTDASAPAEAGVLYRLLETDLSGRERVLAVAAVEAGMTTGIARTETGLSLSVRGAPNASVTVQTAEAVEGPWTAVQTVTLDGAGAAVLNLGVDVNGPARFYRVVSE